MTMNWWMEIWMGSWDSMILYWHWNFQLLGGTWETRPGRVLKEEEKFQRIPPSTNLLPQIWRSTLDIFLIAQLSTSQNTTSEPPSKMCEMVKRLNHHFVMVEFPPKRTRWSKVSQSLCVLQQDDQLLVRALLLVSNAGFGERISPGWFSVIETKGSHTEASPVEMLLCHMKKVGFFSARLEHWGCPWPLHIWCAWSQKTHRNTLMKVFHCHSCWAFILDCCWSGLQICDAHWIDFI